MLDGSRMAKFLRRAARKFLKHSYTWISNDSIPTLDVDNNYTYDDNGNLITTDALPIEDKPCLFLFEEVAVAGSGNIISKTPTLYVFDDDPVSINDTVTNICASDGTVLIESARVETIDRTADSGSPVLKVLRLSGAKTV